MPHAEAALEETINTLKITGMEYTTLQVGCEPVTKEQIQKEQQIFEDNDTI